MVIADPPSDTGALQETRLRAFATVALTLVGAPGVVAVPPPPEPDPPPELEPDPVPAELVAVLADVGYLPVLLGNCPISVSFTRIVVSVLLTPSDTK